MNKVIVTGHNGFIGGLLTNLLVEEGYDVVGIDTNYFTEECQLFPYERDIIQIKKDVREISEKDVAGAFAICHLAALSNDPIGEINPQITYEINHEASVRLAKLAKKTGVVRFIYSSSCSLYGKSGNAEYVDETAEFNPLTAYAKSKVLSEKDILPLSDDDFTVTFLRNSTAYGLSPKLRLDLVVNNLIGWALIENEIKILSDGTPWRPLVHAEDIARAFVAMLKAPQENINKESFNVGMNDQNFQIKEIAYMIQEKLPDCHVSVAQKSDSDSRSYKVKFDKIFNAAPEFQPQWNLEKGIEEIIEGYQSNNMDADKFYGRNFVRLKHLKYLIDNNKLDEDLFWTE